MNDPDLNLPPRLAEHLAALDDRRVLVPKHVDEAILDEARRHLQAGRMPRRAWWIIPAGGGAIAAALVLGLSLLWQNGSPRVARDVDGNGQIDILDALTLARRVESGQPLDARWDFSADGVVDRADADALAMQLVKLARGDES